MESISFGWLFAKTVLAMVAVILLAIWGIRYLMPRLHGLKARSGSALHILERFGLEPRKVLYIVQVGKRRILLGVTDHQINKLADLDAADLENLGESQK